MDATTGKAIDGDAHLAQSIADILGTPIGTCVMRRDYGSMLPGLLDAPQNDATRLQLFAATADALRKWEPRIRVTRVSAAFAAGGQGAITIEGYRTDTPEANGFIRLTIPMPRNRLN